MDAEQILSALAIGAALIITYVIGFIRGQND